MAEPQARRLTIVGGGIMGLMTAYYAAPFADAVTVLEKNRVGDPATASFSLTRSARNDYLDPEYARLAFEARRLWLELQARASEPLLVDCGCLNIVKSSVTPDLASTYAERSFAVLEQLGLRREAFSAAELRQRFPQFAADAGRLDVDAGLIDVPAVTRFLQAALLALGVCIEERAAVRSIARAGHRWRVTTGAGDVESNALVITAGLGTNDVLRLLPGCSVRFPLRADRPLQSKYFIPAPAARDLFTAPVMPVFAYLDVGIYGHPLCSDKTPGVKIGFYNPPEAMPVKSRIASVEDFVGECLPGLRQADVVDVAAASGVDVCWYDLVADDNFIIGSVPDADNVFTGTGWRGTGYKFAPWAGRVLAELAIHQKTAYDIRRFAPGRFTRNMQHNLRVRRRNMMSAGTRTLTERLASGPVLGAEGYLFELERRGYVKAGPYVPEVVLDFPEAVMELHRELLRAGAEVMVALTYYAHREKLHDIGREHDLEAMNRQAVRMARAVAQEGDALVAGNVCNTWRVIQAAR